MKNKLKQKATRLLKNLQFNAPHHNVSLVGAEVGSGANQTKVLLLKQTLKNETIEVKKALEQVSLKMSMEEFLRKFFGLYYDDAEVLTKLLGFETEFEASQKEQSTDDNMSWAEYHQKYLNDRLSQISLMKSLNAGELTHIEKSAFEEIVALQQKLETPVLEYFETKEKQMNELEIAKSAISTLEAEKAAQVEVVKSLESKVAELTEQVNVLKAAEEKVKFDAFAEQLKGLVADEQLESVAKSLFTLPAEASAQIIESMKSAHAAKQVADQVAQEQLTTEQGHAEVVDAEQAKIAKQKEIMHNSILGKK